LSIPRRGQDHRHQQHPCHRDDRPACALPRGVRFTRNQLSHDDNTQDAD
jgi:hypothetical protein